MKYIWCKHKINSRCNGHNKHCNNHNHRGCLWSTDTNIDTGHDTDTDTWTPVKHIKLNLDTGVGVVSDTEHGKGLGCPCFIGGCNCGDICNCNRNLKPWDLVLTNYCLYPIILMTSSPSTLLFFLPYECHFL